LSFSRYAFPTPCKRHAADRVAQNSLRAVVERFGRDGVDGNGAFPPIKVIVVEGNEGAVSTISFKLTIMTSPQNIQTSRSKFQTRAGVYLEVPYP
jgi:hypothetical protein